MQGLTVCLDGRGLPFGGGVVTYRTALGEALALAGARVQTVIDSTDGAERSRTHRLVRAIGRHPRRLITSNASGAVSWSAADLFRTAQVHFDLYGRLLEIECPAPPDVMHWTYPIPLRMLGARNVYTVHDLIPLERPDLTPVRKRRMARLLARVVEAADLIVTVSEASRSAIVHRLSLASSRVSNTYQAAPIEWTAPAKPPPLPLGLRPGGYFIYCGAVERRKNVGRLIAAYAVSGLAMPLVMVGPDGFGAAAEMAAGGAAAQGVVRLPWLERSELLALVAQARALVFPSLAEGFGLPVLEAMALGVPVLTSREGALGEIADKAALCVDPLDVAALSGALAALAHDDALCARLITAGLARAEAFSMSRYVARVSDTYRLLDRR